MVILTFIYMKNTNKKNYDGDENIAEVLKVYYELILYYA